MKKTFKVSLPEAALVVGTRAIAGVGLGLLLGNHLIAPERRRLGWALFAFGALSTVPLAMRIVPRIRRG
jgi:hypothetical protein